MKGLAFILTTTLNAKRKVEQKLNNLTAILNDTRPNPSLTRFRGKGYEITFEIEDSTCSSKIYCPGPILDTIQKSGYFHDNKEFLDKPTRRATEEVIDHFKSEFQDPKKDYKNLTKVKRFLDLNFHPVGYDTEYDIILDDFSFAPNFTQNISDPKLKNWALEVNLLWFNLSRKTNTTKICDKCETTLIDSDYPFVVPGGRFIEYYYWDSYFVIEGLMVSGMYNTAYGMIKNLINLVNRHGFVPNGSRKYYLNRSQPPMLISMVQSWFDKTHNLIIIQDNIRSLEKEYDYWMTGEKRVEVDCPPSMNKDEKCYLNRYFVETKYPRPESWNIDYNIVQARDISDQARYDRYSEIATGAETGWDYTLRWTRVDDDATLLKSNFTFANNTEEDSLFRLQVRGILPVDLNGILHNSEKQLQRFYALLNNTRESLKYKRLQLRRAELILHYFYNKKYDQFLDYDLITDSSQLLFTPSNYWPYWSDSFTTAFDQNTDLLLKPYDKLMEVKRTWVGPIPTTLFKSRLQWDFPNSWAPLEYVLIEGLSTTLKKMKNRTLTEEQVKKVAVLKDFKMELVQNYIDSLYCGWYNTGGFRSSTDLNSTSGLKGIIFEKYSAENLGKVGGGGEYPVQFGFGWSNGVLLHLLNQYGLFLKAPDFKKC